MFLELYLGHCGNTKYERPIFLTFGDFCVSWKKKQGEADVWALYFSSQGSVNHVISLQWLSGTFPRSSYSYGRVEKQKYFWLGEKCVFVGDNCCGAAFVVGVKNFIWSSRFQFIRWSFFLACVKNICCSLNLVWLCGTFPSGSPGPWRLKVFPPVGLKHTWCFGTHEILKKLFVISR